MLTKKPEWLRIAEINPPELPNMSHLLLDNTWDNVLVTDNVFGKIRVSPYAFAARVTHDVPTVHPTVVVSTRDRNILAIESEVRGALGNGVDSFLVVIGDTLPQVDHLAHHHEIVEHLRELQTHDLPEFEVGMPVRFREWQMRKRIERGAQFFVAGPILDADTVEENLAQLRLRDGDPPVFVMVIPPFSLAWIEHMETMGAVAAHDGLKQQLQMLEPSEARRFGWEQSIEIERRAKEAGAAGAILMGLRFDTVVDEAALIWRIGG